MKPISSASPVLLSMRDIARSFPGVQALRGVDLDLHRGEVLALLGENGAGKSTLIKILGGAHTPDVGRIVVEGREARFRSPQQARRNGIAVIHQELNLVPALTGCENIFLGQERGAWGSMSRAAEAREADALMRRLGLEVPLHVPCRRLTMAQQQILEIAKALLHEARIIVMDEPTASLTPLETRQLFAIVDGLRSHGLGIIYISHRLEEIFRIADRIVVLRDGTKVGERKVNAVDRPGMIAMMVGRPLTEEFPKRERRIGEPRLVVSGLRRGRAVKGVSLEIRRGEVLALTGLVGSGRTETARLIFGADRPESGTILLDGRPLAGGGPRAAIRRGIALLSEHRKTQGLVLAHSLRDNFGLPNMDWLSTCGFLRRRLERTRFSAYATRLRIRAPAATTLAQAHDGDGQFVNALAAGLEAAGGEAVATARGDAAEAERIFASVKEPIVLGSVILGAVLLDRLKQWAWQRRSGLVDKG